MQKPTRKIIFGVLLLVLACVRALAGLRICKKGINKIERLMGDFNQLVYYVDHLYTMNNYEFDYSWAEGGECLIAHAFGGVDGNTYTNSAEAFHENYSKGHRIFEVDFHLTEPEGALVAVHDIEQWRREMTVHGNEADDPFSYSHFMNEKLLGKYTPLDCDAVIDLMCEYPDIRIVTDTKLMDKVSVYAQFGQLVRCAQRKNPDVLSRIIPQIYHEEMLEWVMEVYPFSSVIFTLYATKWTPESIYDFCKVSKVRFITAPRYTVDSETMELWDQLDIIVGTHTSNDLAETEALFQTGIDFMYTDFLSPAQFS